MTLVNKDQLDILATLRESVNEDKAGLEADLEKIQKQNKELSDKNRMQLEQINGLLLEKVNLQSEGISQRERMLLREKDFGYVYCSGICCTLTGMISDLRKTVSGQDLPEDIKSRLIAMHEENVILRDSYKNAQEKLAKAKQVKSFGFLKLTVNRNHQYSSLKTKISFSSKSTQQRAGWHLRGHLMKRMQVYALRIWHELWYVISLHISFSELKCHHCNRNRFVIWNFGTGESRN